MLGDRPGRVRAPLKQCAEGGCRVLVRGKARCDKHAEQLRTQRTGSSKNQPGDPFYSSKAWIRLRDHKRANDPLCERCMANGRITPTEHVHHIKNRRDFPELALVYENTEALCARCHNRHTARHERRRAR